MFSKAAILLACSSAALANVFITSPTASTTFSGGKSATIKWQDDGAAPTLKDFGAAQVSIYVGNALQQTRLQTINASVDVSTVSQIDFIPDATIGPNSSEYFIRVESLALKDAAQPQFPALAFSAKFTLDSMTGVFTADVINQINGQSTAPLAGTSTTASTATTSKSAAATTTTATTTGSSSSRRASATSAAASATASHNAASGLSGKVGWAGAVFGALIGVTMF